MPVELKAGRCHPSYIGCTLGNLEHAVAAATMKMMMMCLAGNLITVWLTGQRYAYKPLFVGQQSQRPIHRRDTKPCDMPTRLIENLLRAKRPIGVDQGAPHRLSLLCFSVHMSSLMIMQYHYHKRRSSEAQH